MQFPYLQKKKSSRNLKIITSHLHVPNRAQPHPLSSQHTPNNQETPINLVLRQAIVKITIVKL